MLYIFIIQHENKWLNKIFKSNSSYLFLCEFDIMRVNELITAERMLEIHSDAAAAVAVVTVVMLQTNT